MRFLTSNCAEHTVVIRARIAARIALEYSVTGNRGVNDPKQAPDRVSGRGRGSFTQRFLIDRESEPLCGRHKTPPALLDDRRAQIIVVTTYLSTLDDFEPLTTDIAARGSRASPRGSRRCGAFVYALDPLSARTKQAIQGRKVAI